jgi:hypothetical protein
VSRFFKMELSSPKALDVVDFDEVIVLDEKGAVIARFGVADFWAREWNAVAARAAPKKLTDFFDKNLRQRFDLSARRHCEERRDEAIESRRRILDCLASGSQ